MHNSIKSKVYISLILVAILVIVCATFASFYFDSNKNVYETSSANVSNLAVTSSDVSSGKKSLGDGLADGKVPDVYNKGSAPSGKTWQVYSGGALSGDGYYYMTGNASLSATSLAEGTFSGVLDGCGFKLTINCSFAAGEKNDQSNKVYGFLTGWLNGTIKNLEIEITKCLYSTPLNSGNNYSSITGTIYYGAIAGALGASGNLFNCYIKYNTGCTASNSSENTKLFNVQTYGSPSMYVGMLFGGITGGTIEKCTIDLNSLPYVWAQRKAGTKTGTYYFGICAGQILTGDSTIRNITFNSNSSYGIEYKSSNTNCYGGWMIGNLNGVKLTLDGVNWQKTGKINSHNNARGVLIGKHNGSASLVYSNVFCQVNGSSKLAQVLTDTSCTWACGDCDLSLGEIDVNHYGSYRYYNYDIPLGFSYTNNNKIWIGAYSDCSYNIANNTASGNFVNTVTIGGTSVDTESIAGDGVDDDVIPMFLKTKIDGNITNYTKTGTYVAETDCNIQSVNSITYSSGHSTSNSSKQTTYNGNNLVVSGITGATMEPSTYIVKDESSYPTSLFISSSHTNFVQLDNSYAKDVKYDGANITSYTLYAKDRANYNATNSRYVVCAIYRIDIQINQADGTALTINDTKRNTIIEKVFNGAKHGIYLDSSELSVDGFSSTQNATWRSEITKFQYCNTATGTFTDSEDAYKIEHVSDGTKVIYYKIFSKNYTPTIAYSRSVKITPADVTMNNSYNVDTTPKAIYVYSGNAITNSAGNGITAAGETFFNELMKDRQVSPDTKLEYTTLINSGAITFGAYSSITNVGTYSFTIEGTGTGGGTLDFALQSRYTFSFKIVAATPTISFTPINNTSTVSESCYYDFNRRNLPTDVAGTTDSGIDITSNITRTVTKDGNNYTESQITDVGVYVVTYSFAGNDNINAATYTYNYEIKKNTININLVSNINKVYDGTTISYSNYVTNYVSSVKFTYQTNENLVQTRSLSPSFNVSYTNALGNTQSGSTINISNAGVYTITFTINGNANYNGDSKIFTYGITQAPLRIYFNDTKDLYDSIIDYKDNCFDFIYVSLTDYTKDHIEFFVNEYSKYFERALSPTNGVISISNLILQPTVKSGGDISNLSTFKTSNTTGNFDLIWTWSPSANDTYKNNYDINNVVYNTSGKGYTDGFTSYCESAKTSNAAGGSPSYRVRVKVVSNVSISVNYNDDYRIFDNKTSGYNGLVTFINGHYYDSDSKAQATEAVLAGDMWYHKAYDGSRIMASYKTLNGNGKTLTIKMYKGIGNASNVFNNNSAMISEIAGKSNAYTINADDGDLGSLTMSSLETNFSGNYDQQYPAFTTIDGSTMYYGAATLVALNYGKILNFNINFSVESLGDNDYRTPRLTIKGHIGHNTAIGTIAGINYGIVCDNSINSTRLIRYTGQASGYELAGGQLVGINNGYLGRNTFSNSTEIKDTKAADATHYYYTYFTMDGSASNAYFGLACGINLPVGRVVSMTYTNNHSLSTNVSGNVYGGGFVGKNMGTIDGLTYYNNRSDTDTTITVDSRWTTTFDSGNGSLSYTYRGNELGIKGTGNVYAGGIVGCSTGGEVKNCTFRNEVSGANINDNCGAFKATPGTNKAVYMGGIVGYLLGSSSTTPKVDSCNVLNYGRMLAGDDGIAAYAYALGGIAGVSSKGSINKGNVSNYGKIFGLISQTGGDGGKFVGGLLGVGCEQGDGINSADTYSNSKRITFNGGNIEPGSLTLSSAFNYEVIGANWGSWGYLTGRYNSILEDSINDGYTYAHNYGGLIWYTNNTPSGHTKCVFGEIASILGYNEGYSNNNAAKNVYITGVAGINLSDSGDNTVASLLFAGAELIGDDVNILYSAINASYNGMDVYSLNASGEKEFADLYTRGGTKTSDSNGYTTNKNEGTIKISQEKLNAIITDATIEASIAQIIMRFYINLNNNDQFVAYVQGGSNNIYYAAGYGIINYNSSNNTINGAPWAATMNSLKTLDGNNVAVYYNHTNNDGASWSSSANYIPNAIKDDNSPVTVGWKAVGNIIGINQGEIKNLNLIINTSNNTSAYDTQGSGTAASARTYSAYAPIAGANTGYIHNCTVTLTGGNIVGLKGTSDTNTYDRMVVGGIAGISLGVIDNCQVNFKDNTTLGLKAGTYNTSTYAWIGGAVGLQSGGALTNITIIGKGNIKTEQSTIESGGLTEVSNIRAFVGGIAGIAMYSNVDKNTAGTILMQPVEMQNFVMALVGDISTASATSGGCGYLFGRSLFQSSGLATAIKSMNLGRVLVFANGDPKATTRDAFSVSNTILGNPKDGDTDENLSWSIIPNLLVFSLSDYSYKGLGVNAFITYVQVIGEYPSATGITEYSCSYTDASSQSISIIAQIRPSSNQNTKVTVRSITFKTPSTTLYAGAAYITGTPSVAKGTYTISGDNAIVSMGYATSFSNGSLTMNTDHYSDRGVKLVLNYNVIISTEGTLNYADALSGINNPFMCFMRGRGNRAIFAGAKEAYLQIDITYDKKMNAATTFFEGKVLHGNNHTVSSTWVGDDAGNEVVGLTDNAANTSIYHGNIGSRDYPYYMMLDGTKYYGVSDLVAINYGTIENLKVVYPSNKSYHNFKAINANSAYGAIAGINCGQINNCHVEISNSIGAKYISDSSAYNTIIGAIAGINTGSIENSDVVINSKFEVAGSAAKYVMFGGCIGYHAKGARAINCEIQINGTLSRSASANYIIMGGFCGIASGEINYITIKGSGTLDAGTQSVNKIYVSAAVAIANNVKDSIPNIGHEADQLNIYDCLSNSGENLIRNILLEFNGNFIFSATSSDSSTYGYMVGVIFAKATQYTHEERNGSVKHPAYEGIIISSAYNSDIAMYYLSGVYGSSYSYNGSILNVAGVSLMGWIENDQTGSSNNNVLIGGQITTNASPEVSLSWDRTTGNIIATTSDIRISNVDKAEILYLPNKNVVDGYEDIANIQYLLFSQTLDTTTVTIKRDTVINNLSNNIGNVMQVHIEFYYPAVVINDIFQLVQFLWFTNDDASNMQNYYLNTYKDQIVSTITQASDKRATASNPYGSWASTTQADISTILANYSDNEKISYNGYYLFLEKYYDSGSSRVLSYYNATNAKLGNDLVLNKYKTVNVNLGFDYAQWAEFNVNKILDGQGHSISLIASGVTGYTINNGVYNENQLPSTSKWYSTRENRQPNEVVLSDIMHTPANGDSTAYIFGGFLGIVRGTLKNINFEFESYSLMNITGYLHDNDKTEKDYTCSALAAVNLDHSVFAGVIAGYTTGTIDSCTLSMGAYSQIYVNKVGLQDSDAPWMYHISVGGVTGLLGQGGTISNTKVYMGEGANIGAQQIGNYQTAWLGAAHYRKGTLRTYAGGFAGMMLGNSRIFNATIEGDSTSKIFAYTTNVKHDGYSRFDTAIGAAGGVVGCNTTNYAFSFYAQGWRDFYSGSNKDAADSMTTTPLGAGVIDGVIYNWSGTSISNFYDEQGGNSDKDNLKVYCLKGNIIGVVGDRYNSNLTFTNANTYAKNLYYTYSLDSLRSQATFMNRGAVYAYVSRVNDGVTANRELLSGNGKNIYKYSQGLIFETAAPNKITHYEDASISLSEKLSNTQVLSANTLRIFSLTNIAVSGDGLTIHYSTETKDGNVNIKYGPNLDADFVAEGYTELTSIGNTLKWTDKTIGSNITCEFSVDEDDESSVMWSINIKGAQARNNQLIDSTNTVSEIPVYSFARNIEDAQSYKDIKYTLLRGAGRNMELYYCTGNAASLGPDKAYYTNINDYTTTYYPLKAIMYDGNTEATSVSLNVYDYNGDNIARLSSAEKATIVYQAQANNNLTNIVYVLRDNDYIVHGENEDLKAVGSYKVEYSVRTNGINPNAYISKDYRTQFFSSDGTEADEDGLIETYTIYIVIAPVSIRITSVSKVYDGTTNLQKTTGTQRNYTVIACDIFDYLDEFIYTTATVNCNNGELSLSSNLSTKIMPTGTYDKAEVGNNRVVTFIHESTPISYTLYEESNGRYIERRFTKYYLADNSGTTRSYFSIAGSTVLTNSTLTTKTYTFDGEINNRTFIMSENNAKENHRARVAIVEANELNITVNIPNYEYEYTGSNITYGEELGGYITIIDQFDTELNAANLIRDGELTITQTNSVDVKNVVASGYTIEFRIAYVGNNYTKSHIDTTGRIFVKPALLTVTKVIKDYDGNNNTNNATFVASGLKGSDTLNGLSGTYAQTNIGTGISVTINTTNISINSNSYKVVLTNYYLTNQTLNIGVIVPVGATIENAYKVYDGLNTVTYTGVSMSHILILNNNNEVLNYQIDTNNVRYASINVGKTNLIVTLERFNYIDAENKSKDKFILSNTNYCIAAASGITYEARDIAYILPAEVTVSSVTKEYDGTTDLGQFEISGILLSDSITSFDGEYSDANVKYENNNYNDVLLNYIDYTYTYHTGSTLDTNTVHLLVSGGSSTNYMLEEETYSINDNKYVIEGIGVIIPKLVQLSYVRKYYDGKYTFDAAQIPAWDENVGVGLSVGGNIVTDYYISGRMSGKDATNGNNLHSVTVDYSNFVDKNDNSYIWLVHSLNTYNNYCLANATIDNVGDILKLDLIVTSGSSNNDGVFYDLQFTRTGLSSVKISDGAEYRYNQYYSISNLTAKFRWNGTVYTLTNGALTLDGTTLNFTLNREVTNAGIYIFELTLESASSNFNMEANNTFRFEIRKKALSAAEISVSMTSNVIKVYDGTNDTQTATCGTLNTVRAICTGGVQSATETVTSWSTRTVSNNGINGSAVTLGNIESYINVGEYDVNASVTLTLESTNYTFNGSVTNVYVDGYINRLKYQITPKEIEVPSEITKEFDGSNSSIIIDGVTGEKLELAYTNLGYMPGVYFGNTELSVVYVDSSLSETNTNLSIVENYTITSGFITLTINPARIVTERQYYTTTNGINYFKLAIAITELKGFEFLAEANLTCIVSSPDDITSSSNRDTMDATIETILAMNINDSVSFSAIDVSGIERYNVYTKTVNEKNIYTIEIIYSYESLDAETLTDKYAVYMVDNTLDIAVSGSNIAVSSSELEAGQFAGSKTTTGVEIDTLDKLVNFMISGTGTGYLSKNIYGYDASSIDTTTFTGTLYGNGYTISLTGGYNTNGTYAGLFTAINNGNIYDINFKYLSTEIIEVLNTGLIVGSNVGIISNVSLTIAEPIVVNEEIESTASIGGVAHTSTGTLDNITIIYASDIDFTNFGGLAHTISSGNVNYIAIREMGEISISGKAIAVASNVTIPYAIDDIKSTHTNFGSGTITKLYGQGSTELSMFSDTYTNGYLDYYFTKLNKYTTNTTLHNVYDSQNEDNTNTSYYYGYNQTNTQMRIAIEVIAPLNRFIWEAFDANYLVYQTDLNRAVGLFDLTITLQDSSSTAVCETNTTITFITSYINAQSNEQFVTIFNPAIGIIASAVVSSGTGAVQVKEYTGSVVEATFTVTSEGETYNLSISGTDVGVYTEYYEEAQGEGTAVINGFDPETRVAKVLSSESGEAQATIMLVIAPKTISNAANLTKEYDSTNIAETALDLNSNGVDNVYAVGKFNNSAVGTGYKVEYNSYTRPVAAYNNNFVTVYLSGISDGKRVYTVQYVYANSQALTTTTNITTLNLESLAIAYSKIATINEIQALENDTQHNIVNFAIPGVTSSDDLSEIYIKDLAFGYTTNNTGVVTYTSGIYYATTLYEITNGVENRNYKYVLSTGNVYTGTTLVVSDNLTTKTYVAYTASLNGGSITQRTINATYDNLNQSYRGKLKNISITPADVEEIENLPYSFTQEQKAQLIIDLKLELQNVTFSEDVLGATINNGAVDIYEGDDGYYATYQTYKEIELTALSGNYSVTTNLAVSISGSATLILRYFDYDSNKNKFIIDTIDALLKIDSSEEGNDYQDIDYIVTKNINGKSKLVETFTHTFNGTIDGQGYAIKNIVLVGGVQTGIFNTLSLNASISDVKFMNVLVITNAQNATASVVSVENNGTIENVVLEGYIVSDKATTIAPVCVNGIGTTKNDMVFMQTSISQANVTISNLANDTGSEVVIMLRAYGNKGSDVSNNIVNIYINGVGSKTYTNISNQVKAVIREGIQGVPVTINDSNMVVVNNFRQYWAWANLCMWLHATNTTNFLGYQFEL